MAQRRSASKAAKPKAPAKKQQRGSSAQAERGLHTPEGAGSKPAPATKRSNPARRTKPAPVAQPAEQPPRKGKAAGSKPARGSKAPAATPPSTVERLLTAEPAPDIEGDMNPRMLAFCREYVRTFNGTASYLASHPGTKAATAATESWRLLRNPKVKAWIEQHRAKLAAEVDFGRADVVRELIALATADPGELSQMRQVACGTCWPGMEEKERPLWLDPDPDCTYCCGEGVSRPWFADTRRLSPGARRLFSSVHVTREGMKINVRDQDGALDKLGKVFGAYEADNTQQGVVAAQALRELFLNQLHSGAGRAQVVRDPGRPQKGPLG